MSITDQLEEERRMLARLDDEDLTGLSTTVRDALTALPLRNAQVAAVLAKCEEWQKEGEHWMEEWHKDESAENIPMLSHGAELVELARRVRRAIEEAGA